MKQINPFQYPISSTCYDCIECGQKDSVTIMGNIGICRTPECIDHQLIQFIQYPHWSKPKAGLARREFGRYK